MKKTIIIGVILLLVVIGIYLGKTKLTSTTSPTETASEDSMAPSNNIYLTKTDPAKGDYFTDFQGLTLYIFDKDTTGVSNCEGACLKAWPAYISGETTQETLPENISVIVRSDGSKQFAWKGMPLYYYASDANPGDITGDGFNGVWHIVKP